MNSVAATAHFNPDDFDLDRLRHLFNTDGYVVVDGILSDLDVEELRKASAEVTQLTREGKWAHRRVVGKQFPPYNTVTSQDSWGVQHLMHPDLPHHDLFTKFYGSSPLLDIAAHLLESTTASMQLELFNLLIEPSEHTFALGWHRDDIRPDVDRDQELQRLAAPTSGIQWNACLYGDDCLFLVPGTHTRLRTAEEIIANQTDSPPARKMLPGSDQGYDGAWDVDPDTAKRVCLKAGQTAFYSQRILHRASYLPSRKRATLHGCYGDVGGALQEGVSDEASKTAASERARNVLQHGVDWMRDDSFGKSLPPQLYPMWLNLLEMDRRHQESPLGYSLEG
ncbi:hypothetical protein CBS101457_003591 [Exobasidium rhododendri]|nr:hypothetical protein CBS101457_003591 [Exobasidium rhododendri]